jgi:branched-chain amino acid aminotransferase
MLSGNKLTYSVLNLCRGHIDGKTIPGLPSNLKVSERKITMGDLVEAEKNGSLLEVFGAGTAAIVSAVDKWVDYSLGRAWLMYRIGYEGRDIHMPTGPEGMGPIAKAMYDTIVGIQTGEIESDWSVVANDAK